MHNWIPEEEERFFTNYQGIIYKVMKDLNLTHTRPSYDDLLQYGRIKLYEAYEEKKQETDFPEGFVGYAYRKIRWALLDMLRKEQKHQLTHAPWLEELNELLPSSDVPFFDRVYESEWIEQLGSQLEVNEKNIIYDLVFLQLSVTETAKKHGVSRKTVYTWRKKIQAKLKEWAHTSFDR